MVDLLLVAYQPTIIMVATRCVYSVLRILTDHLSTRVTTVLYSLHICLTSVQKKMITTVVRTSSEPIPHGAIKPREILESARKVITLSLQQKMVVLIWYTTPDSKTGVKVTRCVYTRYSRAKTVGWLLLLSSILVRR